MYDRSTTSKAATHRDEPACTSQHLAEPEAAQSAFDVSEDHGAGPDDTPEVQLDGGRVAWSQCIAGHIVNFNTWGYVNAFGTFEAFYPEHLGRSASDIAWIGSLNVFLLFFLGTITGSIVDAGYFRAVFVSGSALFAFSVVTLSFCTTYWQVLLVQGLCLGVAQGCIFTPITTVLGSYFAKRRAWALGLAATGSATGGLVYPAMVRQLLPQVGYAWTMRIIGLVQISTLIAANLLARPRRLRGSRRLLVDLAAFKDAPYALYAAGGFFCFWGVYFTVFYLAEISRRDAVPPLDYTASLNLLLIFNGVGVLGRLLWSWLADRHLPINVFIVAATCASVLTYAFVAVRSPPALYAWTAVYGLPAAGIQSLLPASLAHLTPDPKRLGVRLGMAFTVLSFATLTGPPIAGLIMRGYLPSGVVGSKVFAGTSIMIGAILLFCAKLIMHKRKATK